MSIIIKYGATTVYNGTVGGNPTSSSSLRPLFMDFFFQNTGSTGQQILSGNVMIGQTGGTTGFGNGPGINAVFIAYNLGAFAAVDSTAQQTFDVRIQHGAATGPAIAAYGCFAKVQ